MPAQGKVRIDDVVVHVYNPDLSQDAGLQFVLANEGDESGYFTVKVYVNGIEAVSTNVSVGAGSQTYVNVTIPAPASNYFRKGENTVSIQAILDTEVHDTKAFTVIIH